MTTALGALPETLEGWGAFVAPDRDGLVRRWSEAAVAQVQRRECDPLAWLGANWERREHVVRAWSWDRRAQEWLASLDALGLPGHTRA